MKTTPEFTFVRHALAGACLLALAACGGGGDDSAGSAGAFAADGRAEALAVAAPAVGTLVLASADAAGKVRSGWLCGLSADGSIVAFGSDSKTVVASDTNNAQDVFVKNLRSGAVARASTTSAGAQMAAGARCLAMTPDARFVLFTDGAALFVKNLSTQALTLVTPPPGVVANNQGFTGGAISDDGKKVAFITVPTQTYVGQYDYANNVPARVMLRDLATGGLATLATDDGVAAHGEILSFELAISSDGKKVLFQSSSPTLVANDGNAQPDMFVRDLATGTTTLVSSDSQGVSAAAVVCCSSQYYQPRFVNDTRVSFQQAQPSSLGDRGTLTKDLASGATRMLLTSVEGDNVMLSADGSRLSFTRGYSGFDRRAYVRNVSTGQEQVVSATAAGVASNGNVFAAILSRDLTSVAFGSNASNLLSPAPPAGSAQVYVKTIATAAPL